MCVMCVGVYACCAHGVLFNYFCESGLGELQPGDGCVDGEVGLRVKGRFLKGCKALEEISISMVFFDVCNSMHKMKKIILLS